LVKIGNSQGNCILNAFVEKLKLEDCELDLTLVEQGLLISPTLNRVLIEKLKLKHWVFNR
jgi:antitoxin component of MazEF toxin-antitoxin module